MPRRTYPINTPQAVDPSYGQNTEGPIRRCRPAAGRLVHPPEYPTASGPAETISSASLLYLAPDAFFLRHRMPASALALTEC